MRVIAGKCRSLPLASVPGMHTRPTTDRIKETLFNVLQTEIPGCSFLDLFAGSGAIGIEALSRGAAHAWFVENDRRAVATIRENLTFTKLMTDADLLPMDALDAIDRLHTPMDIVFIDPPYGSGLDRAALLKLATADCVCPDTLYVVEAALEEAYLWLTDEGFTCIKEKRYKSNKHLFIRRLS